MAFMDALDTNTDSARFPRRSRWDKVILDGVCDILIHNRLRVSDAVTRYPQPRARASICAFVGKSREKHLTLATVLQGINPTYDMLTPCRLRWVFRSKARTDEFLCRG